MIQIDIVCNALCNLVGWDGFVDVLTTNAGTKVSMGLNTSESGLMFGQTHPMLSTSNIRALLPEVNPDDYFFPSVGNIYKKWDVINTVEGLYMAVADGTFDASYKTAETLTPYNENARLMKYLYSATNSAIVGLVNDLMTQKVVSKTTKNLFEHKYLFDGLGRRQNTIKNTGDMVGFEILPRKGVGVTTIIHKIGLQFVDFEGDLDIMLAHSSNPQSPVDGATIHVDKSPLFQWFNVNFILPYVAPSYNKNQPAGGSWYIMYSQSQLPIGAEAVNIGKDFSDAGCPVCNRIATQDWFEINKYIRVSPCIIEFLDDGYFKPIYTPRENYGINVELSVGCDLTDFIISQKLIFARSLQLQVAYNILKEFLYNPSVNVERNLLNVTKEQLIQELDGNIYTHSHGLRGELDDAVKALQLDTTGLDSVCLPCKTKGVKYGVA